jgi:hypothetical protein
MQGAWIVLLVALFLIIVPPLIQSKMVTKAKKEMRCICFDSIESFSKITSRFEDAKVFYTEMMGAPSYGAYYRPGAAASRYLIEIWIHPEDLEKALEIIQKDYRIEETPNALIVRNKT